MLAGSPLIRREIPCSISCHYDTMFSPGTLKLYERWGAQSWSFQSYGHFYGGVRPATNND